MSLVRLILAMLTPPTLGFGGGSPPPPPAVDTRTLIPPMLQSPQGAAAMDTVRQRAANSRGYGGTIVTGPQGLKTPAQTAQNFLKPNLGG